ncbi:gamma-glutamyl-gamma-aminobutyrate hydrolase family protein [Microbacterium maritypicum]
MSIHAALFHVRTRRPRAGAEYQRLLDALNASAVAAVEDMGWTASLHAAGSDPEHSLRRASREADVVVLLGGDDIDPSLYGQSDRRPIRTPYERRADRMQIAVIMDAVSQRRPLLGVCRGHQLLNVALGGLCASTCRGTAAPARIPSWTRPCRASRHSPRDFSRRRCAPTTRRSTSSVAACTPSCTPTTG